MNKFQLVVVILVISLISASGIYAEDESEVEYIVKYKDDTAVLMSDDYISELGMDVVSEDELERAIDQGCIEWYEENVTVYLDDTTVWDTSRSGASSNISDGLGTGVSSNVSDGLGGGVLSSTEGGLGSGVYVTGDIVGKYDPSLKWDLSMVKIDKAYDMNCMGQDVIVGVIDSGVTVGHPDLADNILPGKNFITDTTNVTDTVGHGTMVAGLIAALDNGNVNGFNVTGTAPKTKIVPLKCFSGTNTSLVYLIEALIAAVDDFNCDVINMSFGMEDDSKAFKEAVDYAESKGVIMVASSGNDGEALANYPASYDSVIGVGSVTQNETLSDFSNTTGVYVVAPGSDVVSTYKSNGYSQGSGTSFSTPIVSGIAAAMLSADPELTSADIKRIIRDTAKDLGTKGYDNEYGYGLVDAEACMEEIIGDNEVFLSPVEAGNEGNSVTVYNNTRETFGGQLLAVSQDSENNRMLDLDFADITVPAGEGVDIETDISGNEIKYFAWKSLSDNSPVSNTRKTPSDSASSAEAEPPAEIDGYESISVDMSEIESGASYSLAIAAEGVSVLNEETKDKILYLDQGKSSGEDTVGPLVDMSNPAITTGASKGMFLEGYLNSKAFQLSLIKTVTTEVTYSVEGGREGTAVVVIAAYKNGRPVAIKMISDISLETGVQNGSALIEAGGEDIEFKAFIVSADTYAVLGGLTFSVD